ncbi:MAG TPA: murein transglycosylase [Desulfobacteraceae bacterium]|nr:murein transglycosylase [Desulfobacteraceae bacterium]
MVNATKVLLKSIFFLAALSLLGCHPSLKRQVQRPEEALIPINFFYPHFQDDMELDSLIQAIKRNIEYLDRLDPEKIFHYGPHNFSCLQVKNSQYDFLKLITQKSDPSQINKEIKKHFCVYRAAGRVGNNSVLFTGYFEPIFDARLTPDQTFKYPVYRKPQDLIKVDLSLFNKKYKGESIIARINGKEVVPYYSREQIEMERALEGQYLEIAWLRDPVDVAFLHIQGSGRLRLPDGNTISVGYHEKNGRPYRSIGRYMIDRNIISRDQMSMQNIRSYLSEHPEMVDKVLNHNPSYVFFRVLKEGPLGNIGVPLTPGRSLALDTRLFPKGALGFISCKKPVIDDHGNISRWTKFSRFVLNQDTGGVIKGAGRADIFWGSGKYAEIAAGHMQNDGQLYILIKKP